MSNSSDDLQVAHSFELLTQLHDAAQQFSQRESQLVRDIDGRRFKENRKQRDGLARLETWESEQTAAIEAAFTENTERARALAEERRKRIEKAHRTGVATLMQQARRAKESFLGKLQMQHFSATRNLPISIEAAKNSFAQFSAQLGQQNATLNSLRQQTKAAFRGYPSFLQLLRQPVEVSTRGDYRELASQLEESLAHLGEELQNFRRILIPRLFSLFPPMAFVPTLLMIGAGLGYYLGRSLEAGMMGAGAALVPCAGLLVLHFQGRKQAIGAAQAVTAALARSEALYQVGGADAAQEHEKELAKLQEDYDRLCAQVNEQWQRGPEIEQAFADNLRVKIEQRPPVLLAKNQALLAPKLERFEAERTARLTQVQSEAEAQKNELNESAAAALTAITEEESARWTELQSEWQLTIGPLYQADAAMNAATEPYVAPWNESTLSSWAPPTEFPSAIRFATLDLDLSKSAPRDPRLALPGPAEVSIPLALTIPQQGSILFETNGSGQETVIDTLNNIILRLLQNTPPGKLSFTIIDPAGLGQNFAGLMHLSDFEESLINRRIWTQREQIEERLAELNEHIEKVIQMYLRNEYATITEYNAQAGSVAEKYHFLVVADFPSSFSETAVRRLQSIAASGPRCGVFTLIHWDRRQPTPDGLVPDELRKNSVRVRHENNEWIFAGKKNPLAENSLHFEKPPAPDLAIDIISMIGKASIDANRVEVPFRQISPGPEEYWTNDTTHELRIPIGRTGATKLQYLAIGKGTRQHALFAGKTGSGKSTLFHVIITNLALACSPEQVEFYLIDFKKGVEFKCYANHRLPHARVIAIESDREFGLSVLQRVDDELKRRGDMFRKLGVQDIAGYKRAGGTEPMPRSLLIIDEFQEFFIEDDQVAQNASLLFDRIVRQGRAFGIHVLLGSQTLGGAYTLARATLGQMVIRVALQCNEADAYLIMDDNNPAPRLLSRPGEGIYNDAAGALEGNSPFQVVWLPDEERDSLLENVRNMSEARGDRYASPIVFEGNAPADVRENFVLTAALDTAPTSPVAPRIWLGAPNAIKGPTEVTFHRQGGNHLLLVGQRDEVMQTLLGVSLIALAAQFPAGGARFVLVHTGGSGTPSFLENAAAAVPHGVIIAQSHNVVEVMKELAAEVKERSASETQGPPIFVFIHGLQKFKKLKAEDDFDFSGSSDSSDNAGEQLGTLLSEGSSLGVHVILTLDTYNNAGRFLSRKALREFEKRVVFQMSANDSASLIDSPQASSLGLHRALLYDEHEGNLETFRPYAAPEGDWLKQAAEKLASLYSISQPG